MLRSPVAGERAAAVAKLNAISSTWSHDWSHVLLADMGYVFPERPVPIYRPMTPSERVLIGEILASVTGRWLSPSDIKMLCTRQRRGDITTVQARKLDRIKWKFEHHKR